MKVSSSFSNKEKHSFSFQVLCILTLLLFTTRATFADFIEVSTPETITTQIVTPSNVSAPYAISGGALVSLISNMIEFEIRGASIVFHRPTGQLIIKNTPTNLEKIETILTDLRKSALRQVEIEARIITVTSDDIDSFGLDSLDVDINAILDSEGEIALTTDFADNTTINFPDVVDRTTTGRKLGQEYALGLISKRADIDLIVDSLKSIAEVNTLSAPRLTVFNNQRAHIKIATYTSFLSEVEANIEARADNLFFTIESVVRQAPAGTLLDVTPTINKDGTITLSLHPTFIRTDLTKTTSLNTVTQDSTTLATNNIILPQFTIQTVDTTIVIPDGGIAMIGGLIEEVETKTLNKVPYLSAIPLLGNFFSNEQTRKQKSHLIIFIKATSKSLDKEGKLKR